MFKNNFRTEGRNLSHNRNYLFLKIAGLSLGLWSAILTILFIKDGASFDPSTHKEVKHVYCIEKENANEIAVASAVKNLITE